VRLVQLTDTHLCRARGGTLLGMDTDHSLRATIELVRRERGRIDVLLGTGDLAANGEAEAYQRLEDYFSALCQDHFWLPGNHDRREAMLSVPTAPQRLVREIRAGAWQVLLLDSQVPGEVGGALGEAELCLLEDALAAAGTEGLYSLVCLHHQPVAVGCQWLDEQMVADAEAFFAVLDRHRGVRAVLWGHVHQEVERERGGVRLLASPSTCVQFAPGSARFRADTCSPGYRWLDLHADGRIDSAVSRVTDVVFHVDLESGGYQ